MNQKKIILARPNKIIVKDMKRIITECNYEPIPINDLNMLSSFYPVEVGGVVISTSINSTIDEDYDAAVKKTIETFKGIPIILASLISLEKIKKTIEMKFDKLGLVYNLLSLDEAKKKSLFDPAKEIIVAQKSEIVSNESTKEVLRKFFR